MVSALQTKILQTASNVCFQSQVAPYTLDKFELMTATRVRSTTGKCPAWFSDMSWGVETRQTGGVGCPGFVPGQNVRPGGTWSVRGGRCHPPNFLYASTNIQRKKQPISLNDGGSCPVEVVPVHNRSTTFQHCINIRSTSYANIVSTSIPAPYDAAALATDQTQYSTKLYPTERAVGMTAGNPSGLKAEIERMAYSMAGLSLITE